MKSPKQKIVVIYHGGCRDGFGGAWAAWKTFGDKAAYLPAFDRFAPPCRLKNKKIYLIDYTYRSDVVERLIKENESVTAIDHHITARDAVKLTEQYSFALDHSGAVLAWQHFHPKKKVPFLLRCVEDGDLWKWTLPRSREILSFLHIEGLDFKIWDRIAKELENHKKRNAFAEKGALLLRYERKIISELLPYAEPVRFSGHRVFAVNASHHFGSDLGAILAKKQHSFAIIWSEVAGRIKVSLRSDGTVDVAKIAEKFNGGGHSTAAGFSFDAGKKFPWKRIKFSR